MRFLIACLAAATVLTATPAEAQRRPDRIRLTEESRNGAVLIRVPVQPFDYAMQFSRNGNSGFLSRVYVMNVRSGEPGYRYIARTLAPGRYRLDTIWQQGAWSACLEQGTIDFPVVAGRISFLGTLHIDHIFASIQQSAVERGRTRVAVGDYVMSRPDDVRPVVDGRDEPAIADARQFADTVMNGSGRLVQLAEVGEAAFATSRGNRLIKICG